MMVGCSAEAVVLACKAAIAAIAGGTSGWTAAFRLARVLRYLVAAATTAGPIDIHFRLR